MEQLQLELKWPSRSVQEIILLTVHGYKGAMLFLKILDRF